MNYEEYEKETAGIRKQNDKYLELFFNALTTEGLSHKTIKRHMSYINFYINEFLCYYTPQTMENGCYEVDAFLGDWFIRKAMWSNKTTINENCATFKKFYKLMLELDYIKKEDYEELVGMIKSQKQSWIENLEYYENKSFD